MIEIGIFLAAAGITVLEMAEAAAVGIALYADTKNVTAFLAIALGVIVIFIPTAVVGNLIAYLPILLVRIISATLLLYFGLRLMKSARRSVRISRGLGPGKGAEHEEQKGLFVAGFSVGAVEAFEAAIVLVALYPNSYSSTILGLFAGVLIVVVAAFLLHSQIRKVKQANMKVMVSSILLTFSAFWYAESVIAVSDLVLIPLFIFFTAVVYYISHRGLAVPVPQTSS